MPPAPAGAEREGQNRGQEPEAGLRRALLSMLSGTSSGVSGGRDTENAGGRTSDQASLGEDGESGACRRLPLPWTVRPPLRPARGEGGPGENLLPTGVPASRAPATTPGGSARSLNAAGTQKHKARTVNLIQRGPDVAFWTDRLGAVTDWRRLAGLGN